MNKANDAKIKKWFPGKDQIQIMTRKAGFTDEGKDVAMKSLVRISEKSKWGF